MALDDQGREKVEGCGHCRGPGELVKARPLCGQPDAGLFERGLPVLACTLSLDAQADRPSQKRRVVGVVDGAVQGLVTDLVQCVTSWV